MKKTILAVAIGVAAASMDVAAAPSMEEMWALIQQQQTEIQALKSKLQNAETKVEEIDLKVVATADAVERGVSVEGSEKLTKLAAWADKTTLGGYGEHHFNHIQGKNDQVDAHRFVLFVGHQFSDTVRFFSEVEIEHGFAGPDKAPGEVELEQAYIEWDLSSKHSVVLGQFLTPVGILNETHEPDTFYGTERNSVEKNIIPATWWETGAMFKGELAPGLSYNAGMHSGLEIDTAAGKYKVRDGRQKSAEAVAEDLAYTARLQYTGISGLEVGATLQYQEDITQGIGQDNNSALLTELHAVFSVGDAQLRALWAEWNIDGEFFDAIGADKQRGWYVEPSYKLTENVGIFTRYSEWNNRAGNSAIDNSKVWDYGVNYWLTPTVVLKADYSNNLDVDGRDYDSLNLGLGWSF